VAFGTERLSEVSASTRGPAWVFTARPRADVHLGYGLAAATVCALWIRNTQRTVKSLGGKLETVHIKQLLFISCVLVLWVNSL